MENKFRIIFDELNQVDVILCMFRHPPKSYLWDTAWANAKDKDSTLVGSFQLLEYSIYNLLSNDKGNKNKQILSTSSLIYAIMSKFIHV